MTTRIAADDDFAATDGIPMARELTEGLVHVWRFDLDSNTEPEASLEPVLAPGELERAARFKFPKHRRRFIVGRSTLRRVLARYADCDPRDLGFQEGEHGKPYIAQPVSARVLSFSASGSHGLGGVAVARGGALGFDLEQIRPNPDHELVSARQFCAEENERLRALPEAERLTAFYDIWTCKEAYLKGKGLGLTGGLDRFAIAIGSGMPPRLAWSAIDDRDPERWFLHRIPFTPGFVACLAVEGDGSKIRSAVWPD